ncbi:MAG: DUF2085 domain-containing protein [Chloroflexales bacterium]|nr:DUF2085 domain-containing protein [Chloroflexales bacterium]
MSPLARPDPHSDPHPAPVLTSADRRWTAALLGLVVGLIVGWGLLPGLSLEQKLFLALHGICAQTHNLVTGGVQLPLCARDSGMYLSYLVTVGVVLARGRGRAGRLPPWPITLAVLGLALLMAGDGVNSTLDELGLPHAYPPRTDLRLLTGMGAGIGLALIVLLVLTTALRRDVDDQLRVLSGWRDLGLVLLFDGMIVAALAADTPLLAWPLALLVTVGVIGNLAAVLTLLPAMALGRAGRVTHPAQLAHPATIGLVLAVTFLVALARFRLGLELEGLLPPPLMPVP